MKILYVFRSLAVWGGIERILVEKMNILSTVYNYDVYILTSDQGDHPIPYHLEECVHMEDLNIRFHQQYQYPFPRRLFVARRLKLQYEQQLADRISKIQPDVIVCTTADHIDMLVKLKGSIPLVVESHSICMRTIEDGNCWLRRKWHRYHYLKAISKTDVLVALTEGDAAEWRKVHHNVFVIPNLVHLNDGAVSSLENKRVIFVGRFDYQKRPMEMIRIWEKVYPLHPDWQLDIYGEGEQQQDLQNVARSLNKNIVIHQPTKNIFDCYRESSILVSTSLFEPFGLVIPEAMSCGLPVVAGDCPYGPGDIISDGRNGFLIRYNDTEEFVAKLCLLMSDRGLRNKMGMAGVMAANKYHSAHIMPQWRNLFELLIEKKEK
jgi:glycosyltransferase involved in cell wall biosynthesis